MAHVQLRQVGAGEGSDRLGPLSLELERGEVATVWVLDRPASVGALVRALAGLAPMSGTLEIQGRDVSKRPPSKRDVGVVFGGGALFPHLSVRGNLGRGPVERIAEKLDLNALLDLPVSRIDALARVRVALGRELMRAPSLVMFEDPFPWLPANAARDLRGLVRDVLRSEGVAGLFVATEWADACAHGCQVLVFHEGAPVQTGSAAQLWDGPASCVVALATGGWIEVSEGVCVPVESIVVGGDGEGLEVVVDHVEPGLPPRAWVRLSGRCHAVASDRGRKPGERVRIRWEPSVVRSFGVEHDPVETSSHGTVTPIEAA